ncbi:unnamed protein product [Brassicogethes aeneus]|uniref:Calcium channel flower n=1 Tax=Brassicogethes aeneus TaxID=1431903 RepID=A0A9P0FIW8_BRAAE|nr:unnamed protein product [Brassicogethes aeneus]
MSLQDKISGVMAHPGQDPVVKDNLPRWVKFGARVVGSVGGYVAIFLGVWNCEVILTGNVEAIVAGIWQIVAGLIVISCEAQCKKVQKLSDMVEQRPYWNRALAYVALAVPPILLDIGFTTIFGSGLIFITGVVYGMMALGTKEDRQDMAAAAVGSPSMATSPGMVGGGNIGNTDHHTTLMEDPDVWRPT